MAQCFTSFLMQQCLSQIVCCFFFLIPSYPQVPRITSWTIRESLNFTAFAVSHLGGLNSFHWIIQQGSFEGLACAWPKDLLLQIFKGSWYFTNFTSIFSQSASLLSAEVGKHLNVLINVQNNSFHIPGSWSLLKWWPHTCAMSL